MKEEVFFMRGTLLVDVLCTIISLTLAVLSIRMIEKASDTLNSGSKEAYHTTMLITVIMQGLILIVGLYSAYYWETLYTETEKDIRTKKISVETGYWIQVTSVIVIAVGYFLGYVNFGAVIVGPRILDSIKIQTSATITSEMLVQSDLDQLKNYSWAIFALLLAGIVCKTLQIALGHAWAVKRRIDLTKKESGYNSLTANGL